MISVELLLKIVYFISLTVCLIIIGRIAFFYLVTIKSWQKTEGEIITAEIAEVQTRDDFGWKEKIKYRYFIGIDEFENNKISKNIEMVYPTKSQANQNKFRVGKKVIVSYDPNNPKDSVIDNEFAAMNLLLPALIFVPGFFLIF